MIPCGARESAEPTEMGSLAGAVAGIIADPKIPFQNLLLLARQKRSGARWPRDVPLGLERPTPWALGLFFRGLNGAFTN